MPLQLTRSTTAAITISLAQTHELLGQHQLLTGSVGAVVLSFSLSLSVSLRAFAGRRRLLEVHLECVFANTLTGGLILLDETANLLPPSHTFVWIEAKEVRLLTFVRQIH